MVEEVEEEAEGLERAGVGLLTTERAGVGLLTTQRTGPPWPANGMQSRPGQPQGSQEEAGPAPSRHTPQRAHRRGRRPNLLASAA